MDTLIVLGLVLAVGMLGGKAAQIFKLPNVTGYLLAGFLLGPSFLHLVTSADTKAFSIVNDAALAAIAFSIGSEFLVKELQKVGKALFIITLFEVVGAVLVVFSVTYFIFRQPFPFCIVIASMSAATAPAATLMVIKQYRAAGPLTKTVLPVVALDDVFGIVAFGIAISVAKLSAGVMQESFWLMLLQPFLEIAGSFVLGGITGLLLLLISRKAESKEDMQVILLAAIALTSGVANWLHLSPLLSCIMLGAVLFNLKQNAVRMSSALNDFVMPVYLLFFTLAGASLDIRILLSVGMLGLGYIAARFSGKVLGAWLGAKAAKSEPTVRRYLGLALLPQGGISIGLTVIVSQELPEYAVAINTIIMFSVLVFETSGPIFAKIAIKKAGEINGLDRERAARESVRQSQRAATSHTVRISVRKQSPAKES